MRYFNFLVILGMFVLPICATAVTYYIDISPRENNDLYQMNVNETVTFYAKGYEKNDEVVLPREIDKVWWDFDKVILTKISSQAASISLKALKSGTSKLQAIGMVNNQNCIKTITILVRSREQE